MSSDLATAQIKTAPVPAAQLLLPPLPPLPPEPPRWWPPQPPLPQRPQWLDSLSARVLSQNGVLAPSGVPLPSGDEDQADDQEMLQAIRVQWLSYLRAIQEDHRDEHWKDAPYDAWLKRHPEDRSAADQEAAPAAPATPSGPHVLADPQTNTLTARSVSEPVSAGRWWLWVAAAAAIGGALLFHKSRSGR